MADHHHHQQEHDLNALNRHDLNQAIEKLEAFIRQQIKPPVIRRFIRLEVVGVHFPGPKQFGQFNKIMAKDPNPSSLSIDLPASSGPLVRLPIAPLDKDNKPEQIEAGTLKATVTPDPTAAQVAISPDQKFVDILLPDVAGATATVELDADPNLATGDQGEVITTIITLRRLGAAPEEAVTLGVDPAKAQFLDASAFGVFPASASKRK